MFLQSWYKFNCVLTRSRTSLIGAANLSPVTKLVAGTGAVSRYKLSRSQKSVKVQDLDSRQVRVSGFKNHHKFVLSAGVKAKTVTTCPASGGKQLTHSTYDKSIVSGTIQ